MGHDTEVMLHCAEINRCNQRGGRMLSVTDLLEAGTLPLDLAAALVDRVWAGDSFMVGANPGGAGKTTVMGALLNFVPADCGLAPATAEAVRRASGKTPDRRTCFVAHEIGAGPYFAYLWGEDLRAYCALHDRGHQLATNLHADDLDEARDQVCVENGVPRGHFNRFRLLVFLVVEGRSGARRRLVERVYASTGEGPHDLVYDRSRGLLGAFAEPADSVDRWRSFLGRCCREGTRTIEDVRARVLAERVPGG